MRFMKWVASIEEICEVAAVKLDFPRKEVVQQGMIFSCCEVEGYGCEAWGVVITARCDLANSKAPILNYLPVVKFSDWIERDGLAILRDRASSEVEAEVNALLRDLGAPSSVLLGTPLDSALRVLIDVLDEKARKPFLRRAENVLRRNGVLMDGLASPLSKISAEFPKLYASIVRELMTHRLSGYYYLCRVDPDEDEGCYVVLLRHLGSMPAALASRIPLGVRRADAEVAYERFMSHLRLIGPESCAMPLGVIPSPYVEHLMQSFSTLFGRIGLPNPDPSHIDKFARVEAV